MLPFPTDHSSRMPQMIERRNLRRAVPTTTPRSMGAQCNIFVIFNNILVMIITNMWVQMAEPAPNGRSSCAVIGVPRTMYCHAIWGNSLGPMLYVAEKQLAVRLEHVDSVGGESQDFVIETSRVVPMLCDGAGNGVWDNTAIFCCLAQLAGEHITEKTKMALEWRQATCHKYLTMIYLPYLGCGGNRASIDDGVKGLKQRIEPVLTGSFLGTDRFIGGAAPSVADFSLVPCLTMLSTSKYWDVADERVKTYVTDFQSTVGCWAELSKAQSSFVASRTAAPS